MIDFQTLTAEEVLGIHEILVGEFLKTDDPISPPGVRSTNLLESAVARQFTSHKGILKYANPISNAATLLYGICSNHPFHNGNKRTALVSMIAHLDRNKLTLINTSQKDLYNLMIKVADHSIVPSSEKRARKDRSISDQEVEAITRWLKKRAYRMKRGERQITYRELRHILENFDFKLENPKNNMIDVFEERLYTQGIFKKSKTLVLHKIGRIHWPGENKNVAVKDIKIVRNLCKLTEEYGTDSASFYTYPVIIDSFVNRYRKVLNRLAKV